MKRTNISALATVAAAMVLAGCFTVKTESEIKPIHITMDINLKVDKELDRAFADEKAPKPKGDFAAVKAILERKAGGIDNLAMFVPRDGASDDDKITLAEANARRMRRFKEIAQSSGVGIEAVQRRRARKMRDDIPAGSGVWFQEDDGAWKQK